MEILLLIFFIFVIFASAGFIKVYKYICSFNPDNKRNKEKVIEKENISMNEMRKKLYQTALEMRNNSYSPYSNFSVGAALLCADGSVYTGCNIENISYSLTICAERTAFFNAVQSGRRDFRAIAIAGGKQGSEDELCVPCGACLQVMSEFGNDDFIVILKDGEHTLREFLPKKFHM